jgi:hypothetical protein
LASFTTAPSTHPPLTEPAISISADTINADPTGRGEDPQVWMTRAMAKGFFSLTHLRIWGINSFIFFSIALQLNNFYF